MQAQTPYQIWGRECGPGWNKLINPIVELCTENNVEILQIKEKFGGLRFYVDEAPLSIHDVIENASKLSFKTCEVCGEPGELRGGSWITVRCDRCCKGRSMQDEKILELRMKN